MSVIIAEQYRLLYPGYSHDQIHVELLAFRKSHMQATSIRLNPMHHCNTPSSGGIQESRRVVDGCISINDAELIPIIIRASPQLRREAAVG